LPQDSGAGKSLGTAVVKREWQRHCRLMQTRVINRIVDIPAGAWNAVAGTDHPFTRHEFLAALERHDCVGERFGWLPCHILAEDADGHLLGAVPCYLKDNSYGEFVFDWAWADAYQRMGLPYFPKLVASIPYTPVTGPRLLVRQDADHAAVTAALIHEMHRQRAQHDASSIHCLFSDAQDTDALCEQGFMRRTSCHFHWHNDNYTGFDDFLSRLSSRKRKKIRRERRHVQDAGLHMELLTGGEATEEQWQSMHTFYRSTFERKSGIPTLSLAFFLEISRTMGDQVLLVFARHGSKLVAGAIMLRSSRALYGRHWGCLQDYHSLHFETCYYQGIDYCIGHGLTLFEPGAQGEHKISRGFLPTFTWSAHWIEDARFRDAIRRYLDAEHAWMLEYRNDLQKTSPFRRV
jgi:predicted N-acyltransferase